MYVTLYGWRPVSWLDSKSHQLTNPSFQHVFSEFSVVQKLWLYKISYYGVIRFGTVNIMRQKYFGAFNPVYI